MKNLLILIVIGAVFLHFYPQPELENWFDEQKEEAIESFSEATDTSVRLKVDKILEDLAGDLESFNSDELNYLEEITASRESVRDFFKDFCQGNLDSPLLHRVNEEKVCKVMGNYQTFF